MNTQVVTITSEDYLPGRRIPRGVAAVRFTFRGPEALVEEVSTQGTVTLQELVSRDRARHFLRQHTRRAPRASGRVPHPLHPGHPYRNGPAVWGGRGRRGPRASQAMSLQGTAGGLGSKQEVAMPHYSPTDLQLGAEVQAQLDLEAAGQRFGVQVGPQEEQRDDRTVKYLLGAAVALGAYWVLTRE